MMAAITRRDVRQAQGPAASSALTERRGISPDLRTSRSAIAVTAAGLDRGGAMARHPRLWLHQPPLLTPPELLLLLLLSTLWFRLSLQTLLIPGPWLWLPLRLPQGHW